MRIVLDATGIEGRYGGVSRYACKLAENLVAVAGEDDEFLVLVQEDLDDEHPLVRLGQHDGWRVRPLATPALGPRRQLVLARDLRRLKRDGDWDALHTLRTEAPLYQPFPTAVTIHDIKYLQDPSFLLGQSRLKAAYLRWAIGLGLRQAGAVLTVSEHTKSDVVDTFSIDQERVHVTHLGSDLDETLADVTLDQDAATLERLGVDGEFVLWIGSFLPHKNVENMLRGFARYKKEAGDEELAFVAVGDREHRYDSVLELAEELGVGSAFVSVHGISDEALASLHRQAAAFCFVSRYEGFGIPILEAMQAGTPVITSATTATAETAGGAALCVDPEDPEAIAEALREVRTSDETRRRLVEAGRKRAREFSWTRTAQATYRVYEELADGPT